jgi:Anti-sigma-K factor rskA
MDVRARMMAEGEREAALLECAGQLERPEPNKRRSRRLQWPAAVVAALACSAALAGLGAGALLFAGDGERTVAMQSQIPQASAELEVGDDGATLVATGLPPAPAGETYMVWLKRPGLDHPEPTSVLFTPRSDGSATASVPGALDDVESVLVNTEAPPGPMAPTSEALFTATLT